MNYQKAIGRFDIVDKDGVKKPFNLNPEQLRFLEAMTGRDVILKSRQIGFSSLILALFTIDFLTKENSRSVVISHDAESATKLFDRVKFFIQSAQDKGLATNFKYNSRNELFDETKNSTFYVGKAGTKSFGRGDTITNLHLSEFAFYPDPKTMFASVIQAVVPNGRVIIESTANGYNYFQEFWTKSKQGENGFTPHFFSRDFYPQEFLETKRKEIGDDDLFNQEYPDTDSSAFISSGRPFFNMENLRWYQRMCTEPEQTGYMMPGRESVVNFQDNPKGFWKIWEEPKENEAYIIAADVGEKSDYCAAAVLKRRTNEIVATFHAHVDPGEYAANLALAGRWYNTALIVPEKNGLGLAVVTSLKALDYPQLYRRTIVDKVTEEQKDEVGWLTTSTSRPLMLGNLQTSIADKDIKIPDADTIAEMMSFVRNEKTGKPEAERGCKDDRVMVVAILARVSQEVPAHNSSWDDATWELQEQQEQERLFGKGMY